jgi:hypothetical protein
MPFMVIYRTPDGSPCFEQADAIDEAALLVERLRNKDGLDQIRIYRMEEISFAFRPYYKVELGMSDRQSTPTPPSASTAVVVEGPVPEPEAAVGADAGDPAPPPPVRVDERREVGSAAAGHLPSPAGSHDATAAANGRRGLFGR